MGFFDKYLQPGRTAKKPVPQMSVNKPVYGPTAPTMSTPKPQAQIQAVKPKTLGQSMPLSTTSYGQNTLKQPSNPFSRPSVVGPSGQAMSSVPQMSVATQPSLEQMQAKNQALRQSQGRTAGQVQASSGPVVQPAPKLPPPPSQGAYGGSLNPSDPAAIGGAQMNRVLGSSANSAYESLISDPSIASGLQKRTEETLAKNKGWTGGVLMSYPPQYVYKRPDGSTENVSEVEHKRRQAQGGSTAYPGGGTGPESGYGDAPAPEDQIATLRKQYLDSLGLSPEEQAAQAELSGISGTAASESARAKQEYADRIKAIQDQATLQPFLTGRQIQASGQLNNQLDAITSATEAQTMPLQARLSAIQAQREMERKRRETELGFAQKDKEAQEVTPVEVGGRLVNPRTGQVVYSPPAEAEKPMTLSPGETVYDPATGRVLFTAPERPSASGGIPTIKEINGTSYQWDEASGSWVQPSGAMGAGSDSAVVETLNGKLQLIDDLMTSPGMRGSVGPYGVARWTPFSADAAARQDFAAGVNQLISKDTMDVLLNLKKQGGTLGALSDQERILLQSAASKVGTWMIRDKNGNPTGKFAISEDLFKKELQTIRDLTQSALERAGGGGGGSGDELDQMLDSLGFDNALSKARKGSPTLKTLTIGNQNIQVDASIALRLAKAAKDFKAATGKELKVNQDFRTHEEQARLYKELSAKGARVAPPGQSFHEKGLAIDVSNWQEAGPYLRRYGLVNDLPDDRGHFSYSETRKVG